SAGDYFTCALKDGGAWCWGSNTFGQLGVGRPPFTSRVPLMVPSLTSGVSAIAAGGTHACVLRSGGVACWGGGGGVLGNGTRDPSFVPVPVDGLARGVRGIDADNSH